MNDSETRIPANCRLKLRPYRDGFELVGNQEGLRWFGDVCLGLSQLSAEEAATAANHYHFADYMNNADEGSLPLVVRFDPNA